MSADQWVALVAGIVGGALRVGAPFLFVSLGESVGGISHIVSYWEFRFPKGKPVKAPGDEVLEILQEFEGSFVTVDKAA